MVTVSAIANVILFITYILLYFLKFPSFIICYISPVFFAIFNACPYGYYYSLPSCFNFKVGVKDGEKFVIAYAMGETLLVALAGYLMAYIHPMSLFFYILFFSIITQIVLSRTIAKLREESKS